MDALDLVCYAIVSLHDLLELSTEDDTDPPAWVILSFVATEDDFAITARPAQPLTVCPSCGRTVLLKHGTDSQVIRVLIQLHKLDGFFKGMQEWNAHIQANRQVCAFWSHLPDSHGDHRLGKI